MKTLRLHVITLLMGMFLGIVFMAGSGVMAGAAGGSVLAVPAAMDIRVDGQRADIEAYGINGSTFVRLVDVGMAVDFNVYWDGAVGAVQVESDMPYTGKASTSKTQSAEVEAIRQEIVSMTNEVRKKYGQKALAINAKLMDAAQVRATELAATTTYAHTRPDGRKFNTVSDCPYMGENIHRISTSYMRYYGMDLAETAMDGWVNSKDHMDNIINPDVSTIGVGIAKGKNASGEEAWYCVQLFVLNGCVVTWVDEPVMK